MTNPVGGASAPRVPPLPPDLGGAEGASRAQNAPSFESLLFGALGETNALQTSAQSAIEQSLSGGDITQIEVVSAVKKADLAMRLMIQIRNKLHEAYQEIQQLRM